VTLDASAPFDKPVAENTHGSSPLRGGRLKLLRE
jgi:hypothetical protein